MNKRIKIIDLLEMFYKKEKMPQKIKVSCYEFEYDEEINAYFNLDKNSNNYSLIQNWLNNASKLNNEVEILEDNTEEQENLGESWKEVGKRVGEWAKEFEQGFKESFTEIVRYPFEKLEDNTEEIEELKYDVVDENGRGWYKLDTIADKVTELVKTVNKIRKDLNK